MYLQIGSYFIRDFCIQDAAVLAKYASNPNIAANLRDGFPYPYKLTDAETFLSHVISQFPRTVFAIATEREAIGSIGLMIGKDVHRFTAELGYWLAEPFWGKGIMSSAVKLITRHGFEQLGLIRIYAEPYESNTASIRVLQKAGFEFEAKLKANAFKNDKIINQMLYSKVNL